MLAGEKSMVQVSSSKLSALTTTAGSGVSRVSAAS